MDAGVEAQCAEQLGGLGCKGLVDFHYELPARGEAADGILPDGAVKEQRVAVRHEESLSRVVV